MRAKTNTVARDRKPPLVTADKTRPFVGQALERIEDAALLTGHGRYADDTGEKPGTLHAAILRSPHAHALIHAIDTSEAMGMPGVRDVLTGEDVKSWSKPFVVGVKQPMEHWSMAMDRARYVGEPVAVVVAEDRYTAEDALEHVHVVYEALPVAVDAEDAAREQAPVLHGRVGSNVVSDRHFRYGEPEQQFKSAEHNVAITVRYPRNSGTPIECYVVLAEYLPSEQSYEIFANFQGPFALHPVMARALAVQGSHLRLRTPADSGGSFGIKQGIFPYIVLMGLASRKAGAPVKWVEDRLEHLQAASAATNRVTTLRAAVSSDGRVHALDYDQLEDCGAYLRAPEPATLYRMHGTLTGAYDIPHLAVRNRVVLTNKTPTGLNRGFGGPQVYYALERLMHKIAVELEMDPLQVIRRNLIPADAFPYRCAVGSLIGSGNYLEAIHAAVRDGGLQTLIDRREAARAEGRLYGIGYTAAVEPSISNMGYITTVLTADERAKAGPKNGAIASATVNVDPLGSVSVTVASTPQGQGHRTVLAQVVADALGLEPADIAVNTEMDTQKDPWSIAAGNYSSRFAGAVAGAAHVAARRIRNRLADIAAPLLDAAPDDIVFADHKLFSRHNPDKTLPFHRAAGSTHWAPGTLPQGMEPALRETAFWTPPELTAPDASDVINSSGAYGFIFDYCGVEVDRHTGRVRIDRYVTQHDAGRLLNPALANGQIRGGFAQAVGAALYEEFSYAADGSFLSGTFADYLVPTAPEVPEPIILHLETPSPYTPLGAKGLGEGNSMSTPVCIANAVADALSVNDITLPLTPPRVRMLIGIDERPPSDPAAAPDEHASSEVADRGKPALAACDSRDLHAPPAEVFRVLTDPDALARIIPGCRALERAGDNRYNATVNIGVGLIRGRYECVIELSELDPPRSLRLGGHGVGGLGSAQGSARVHLDKQGEGTRLRYEYTANLNGKLAAVGSRMLSGATKIILRQLFDRIDNELGATASPPVHHLSWWRRLLHRLGSGA